MNSLKRILLLGLISAFPIQNLHAADSTKDDDNGQSERWYESKGGHYVVKEILHGGSFAQIALSKKNEPRIYIVIPASDTCSKSEDGNFVEQDPILVNDVLTKFQYYCDGGSMMFLASTDRGNKHLIEQFKSKKVVEIKSYKGSVTLLFSAAGFTEYLNLLTISKEAI
jgi:hypothetical protein